MAQSQREDVEMGDRNRRVIAAALGLVSFGAAYSYLINYVERTGEIEGKSSLFVALGTFVTLVIRQVMPAGFVYDLLAFAFSGTPMILNQLENHRRDRARARRRMGVWHNSSGPHMAGQKKPGTRPQNF